MRTVGWLVVGVTALATLAGCGRSWIAEREPWRREAEADCLKSGAVKQSAAIAMLKPIDGPGVCGATFPLKVAALGEASAAFGYADELRPPGAIPGAQPSMSSRPMQIHPEPEPGAYPSAYPAPRAYPGGPVTSSPYPASSPYPMQSGQRPATYQAPPSPTYQPSEPDYDVPDDEDDQPPVANQRGGYPPNPAYRNRPMIDAPRSVAPSPRMPPAAVPLGRARGQAALQSTASVSPPATLACPIVSALDRWITDSVQPAALRWFNQPVAEIKQISAYSCRGMNGQPGARISEHAFGNALDIAWFVLADGRKVTVKDGWRGLPEEQGFLRDIQAAACELFTTVLAPGSNRYHYDHIHVDLMRRASGRRICEPGAVSGEEIAARAAQRYSQQRRDPEATGSVRGGSRGRSEPRDDEHALHD